MRSTCSGRTPLGAQLCAGVDARVDDDAAGKGLVGVEADLEALAQVRRDLGPVVLGGDGLHHAARRLQRARAGGEAVLRHQRGHQPGACGAAGVEGLGHGAELLAHAHRLRRRDAQRHGRALRVQAEQAGARGRGTHRPGAAGDVPAAVVVVGIHGIADAAAHVDAQHQRVDQGAAAGAGVLGQRQQRAGHRTGRMDDGLEVRVVEVEGVRADAVDQRRAGHVHALAPAEQGGLRRGLKRLHRRQRGAGSVVVRGADGAADPVDEGAVRLVVDGVAPASARVAGDESREDVGDWRGVMVGGDLGVAGHGAGASR
jgi:hypothetical protein